MNEGMISFFDCSKKLDAIAPLFGECCTFKDVGQYFDFTELPGRVPLKVLQRHAICRMLWAQTECIYVGANCPIVLTS